MNLKSPEVKKVSKSELKKQSEKEENVYEFSQNYSFNF